MVTDGAPPRQGPRPLPLYLTTAAQLWASSQTSLPFLASGWIPWSAGLAARGRDLQREAAAVDPEALARALASRIGRDADAFVRGLQAYRAHPYRRTPSADRPVAAVGRTRLLDYGTAAGGQPLLVIPSLVNRAYILDLAPGRSLLADLAGQGFRPLLVDWGEPGPEEAAFTLTDYVAGRLEALLERAIDLTGQRPAVLGYCMGGLLAVALATRRPRDVASLVLLATPWDFHAKGMEGARLWGQAGEALTRALQPSPVNPLGMMPVDLLQSMFFSLDPQARIAKFIRFAALDPASAEAEAFVALEDWANDGVPLVRPVAQECLVGWYGHNSPAERRWTIAGHRVDPGAVACPTLLFVPKRDQLVPPGSAARLAADIPGATRLDPRLGHVGMVVARAAPREMWEPLARWLRAPERAAP